MKQIIILLFSILLVSCSTRKVVIDNVKKDNLSHISTKTIIDNLSRTETKNDITTDEFTITPLDSCRDIVIDGKTYRNVTINYKKTKDNTIQVKDIKVSKKELKTQDTKVTQNRKVKDIERTSYNAFWLLLIPLALWLFYEFKIR